MKTILTVILVAITVGLYAQSPYKNIQVNEKIHFQGDSAMSCYVVIKDVSVNSLKDMKAMYTLRVYKSKSLYEKNEQWFVPVDEITHYMIQFTPDFTQGDLFQKVSESLKAKLLEVNKTWESNNIIIE